MPWICSIYETRPEFCRKYPESDSYLVQGCGFYFVGDERRGACDVECDARCCRTPREGGEPMGYALPEEEGGLPCKYIKYVDPEDLPPELVGQLRGKNGAE